MYRFHKHREEWRYAHKTWNASKPVDIFALERILGVVGGPKVIVVRKQPGSGQEYHITVENGFITEVNAVYERTECVSGDGGEQCFTAIDRTAVLEFLATEITL
jgi:hypothetical protein